MWWHARRSRPERLSKVVRSSHARRRRPRRFELLETRAMLAAGADPSALVARSVPVFAQGLAVDGVLVAAFADAAGAEPASNFRATIDWGDGSPASAGAIVGASGATDVAVIGQVSGSAFYVTGSHVYASGGDFKTTVTIVDSDGSQATVNGDAQVGTAARTALVAHGVPVFSQGLTLGGRLVAGFVDAAAADPVGNYHATIDWGDGSPASAGTIDGVSGSIDVPLIGHLSGGAFYVTGGHAYAAGGDYSITVTIVDRDGSHVTAISQARIGTVRPPTLDVHGLPVVQQALAVDAGRVAAFVDTAGADAAANYSATIDWGDPGAPGPTAGTVSASGNGFAVTGSHAYAAGGTYELKIAIADQDGATANVVAHAFIDVQIVSFIANAFHDVLGRPADDQGLGFWNQQIENGVTPAQFAADLAHSPESYSTNVIVPAYQKYLGRSPDASGLAYWTSQMQQGLTDQQLAADLAASPEFYANAGGTNAGWVNAIYQVVLGRAADPAGTSYWTSRLSAGASQASVAAGFAASAEHATQMIQDDYFTYLGRAAADGEVNYWLTQFDHGTTSEDIDSAIVGSSEYVTRQ